MRAFLIITLLSLTNLLFSQISGPSNVTTGQNYNYSSTQLVSNPNWDSSPPLLMADNGFNADIYFMNAGTYTIYFKDGNLTIYSKTVTATSESSGSSSPWTEVNGEVYYTGNVGVGNTNPSYKLDVTGTARATDDMIADRFIDNNNSSYYADPASTSKLNQIDANYYDVNSGNGKGLRFWNNNAYKIHMGNASENKYGPVQDYSIKMNMNNVANRGWTWGVSGSTPVAAINTQGVMQIKNNFTTEGNIYGKYVNNQYSNLYRFGGIYFTWDSNSYGTNTHHSIRSTYGDSYGDHLTMNSFGNLRFNFDSNSNGTNVFQIGHATIGTGNVLFHLNESGNLGLGTTSPAEKLHVNGAIRGHASGGSLRVKSSHGYVDIGPQNSSWSHFSTDRSRYYFNKGITVDQGLIGSYDENLQIQTSGTTRITVNNSNGNVGIGTAPNSNKLEVNGVIGASGGNSSNWNAAYAERGSQIAGTGLTWSGGKLNATSQNSSLIITGINQWNPDNSSNPVFAYDDNNPTYNGKYVGAIIDIRGDGAQDAALVRTGAYHADHFQASRGFYVGNPETNGSQIIDASGNINTSGTITGSNLNISNWNTAYNQRGSQIAGTGLNWSGGKLNVTGVNTDDQIIDVFSLSGTTLSLSLESDGQPNQTVDLTSIDTDNQDLQLTGNTLSLSNDATAVDLSSYLDNTDNQDLELTGNTLSLTNDGTSVDLSSFLDNTDSQTLSIIGNDLSISEGNTIDLSGIDTNTQLTEAEVDAYVANNGYLTTFGGNLDLTGIFTLGTPTLPSTPIGVMYVNGASYFTDINVQANGAWPDFVFSENYKLLTLKETEEFINKNQHLPEVPSAREIEENGIDVGEMNKILLKKIEELTLHLIDQNKQIESLKEEVNELKENK